MTTFEFDLLVLGRKVVDLNKELQKRYDNKDYSIVTRKLDDEIHSLRETIVNKVIKAAEAL